MTWVRRTPVDVHTCPLPMRERVYQLPSGSMEADAPTKPQEYRTQSPDGAHGEVWRCHACGQLWRIGDACDMCDWYGSDRSGSHGHAMGLKWRHASLWQRIAFYRRGRP